MIQLTEAEYKVLLDAKAELDRQKDRREPLDLESDVETQKPPPLPIPEPHNAAQVGGTHYKDAKMDPAEFCFINGIPFNEGNVIKYVFRWRKKNGIVDLKKAKHFIDILIALEEKHGTEGSKS